MPNYDFRNKETGEIIEVSMSMTALDKYKEEHPELDTLAIKYHIIFTENPSNQMDLRKSCPRSRMHIRKLT